MLRYAAAADEQVLIAVVVEIACDGDAGIDAIGYGGKSVGGKGKMAFAVVEKKAELHLPAKGRVVVASGSDKEVGVSIVIGVKEEDCFVVKILELVEGGLG